MPKSIGILTWHRTTNPGAFLQAFSQAAALQERFPDDEVKIVDLRSRSRRSGHLRDILSDFARGKFNTFRDARRYSRAVSSYLPLDGPPIQADDYEEALSDLDARYDVLVVGSDELWKTLSPNSGLPFPNPFFLSPQLRAKKIAFAVSANGCPRKGVPEDRLKLASDLVDAFDFLGVRDDHTIALLQDLGTPRENIHKVPDPTFSFRPPVDSREAVARAFRRVGLRNARKIVGVYGYFDSNPMLDCLRDALNTFEKRGWTVVSMKYDQDITQKSLHGLLDPFQWAEAFKRMDLCITNTFHGTLFSIMGDTPVMSIEQGSYYKEHKGKISDVLEDMDLSDLCVRFSDRMSSDDLVDRALWVRSCWSDLMVARRVVEMRNRYYKKVDEMSAVL